MAAHNVDIPKQNDRQSSTCELSSRPSSGSLSSSSPQHWEPLCHPVGSACLNQTTGARETMSPVGDACCLFQDEKYSSKPPTTRLIRLCSDCNIACYRDVADNLDRNGVLDRKLQEANKESDDIHLIIETLRWGNDSVSYSLLAGLRLGISVQDLAWAVRTGSVPSGYG